VHDVFEADVVRDVAETAVCHDKQPLGTFDALGDEPLLRCATVLGEDLGQVSR
jgi:hypothetical protein